jgi:hypothetical protein
MGSEVQGENMAIDASRRFQCTFNYAVERYESGEPLRHTSALYYSEADVAPQYQDESGIPRVIMVS